MKSEKITMVTQVMREVFLDIRFRGLLSYIIFLHIVIIYPSPFDRDEPLHGDCERGVDRGRDRDVSQGQQHREEGRQNLEYWWSRLILFSYTLPAVCRTRCGSGWRTWGCWRWRRWCRGRRAVRSEFGMRCWIRAWSCWQQSETNSFLKTSRFVLNSVYCYVFPTNDSYTSDE